MNIEQLKNQRLELALKLERADPLSDEWLSIAARIARLDRRLSPMGETLLFPKQISDLEACFKPLEQRFENYSPWLDRLGSEGLRPLPDSGGVVRPVVALALLGWDLE